MPKTGAGTPAIRRNDIAELGKPTRFKPGQSGNPSGRPKKRRDIEALAQEQDEKAMKVMARLLNSTDERVALAAAQAILDRGHGKPRQSVSAEIDDKRDAANVSDAELLAIARMGSPGTAKAKAGKNEPDSVH